MSNLNLPELAKKFYEMYAVGCITAGEFPAAGMKCIGRFQEFPIENEPGQSGGGEFTPISGEGLYLKSCDETAFKIRRQIITGKKSRQIPLENALKLFYTINNGSPLSMCGYDNGKKVTRGVDWSSNEWRKLTEKTFEDLILTDLRKQYYTAWGKRDETSLKILNSSQLLENYYKRMKSFDEIVEDYDYKGDDGKEEYYKKFSGQKGMWAFNFCLGGRYSYPDFKPFVQDQFSKRSSSGSNEGQLKNSEFVRQLLKIAEEMDTGNKVTRSGSKKYTVLITKANEYKGKFSGFPTTVEEDIYKQAIDKTEEALSFSKRTCWLTQYPMLDLGKASEFYGHEEAEHVLPFNMTQTYLIANSGFKEFNNLVNITVSQQGLPLISIKVDRERKKPSKKSKGKGKNKGLGKKKIELIKVVRFSKRVSAEKERLHILYREYQKHADNKLNITQGATKFRRNLFELFCDKVSKSLRPSLKLSNQIKSDVLFLNFENKGSEGNIDVKCGIDKDVCDAYELILFASIVDLGYQGILARGSGDDIRGLISDFKKPRMQKECLKEIVDYLNDDTKVGKNYIIKAQQVMYKYKKFKNRILTKDSELMKVQYDTIRQNLEKNISSVYKPEIKLDWISNEKLEIIKDAFQEAGSSTS